METPQRISFSINEQISFCGSYFTVKGFLGEGGFGTVYKVSDANDNEFALKISKLWELMPQEREEMLTRIKQEYEIGNRITSRYLVKYHKFGLLRGNPSILMDYCSGGSLNSEVGKEWSDQELVVLSKQILKGIKALHDDGIIHRDIKPENILFNQNGDAVVVDFGISASLKKRHTIRNFRDHVKNVWLTGVYSPPEQGDFSKAFKIMGPTNDIFAYGVVLFELISKGKYPHGTLQNFVDNMEDYEEKKRNGIWQRNLIQESFVSNLWESIINKCLYGNPLLRYTSVKELMDDIELKLNQNDFATSYKENTNSGENFKDTGYKWVFRLMNGDAIGQEFNLSEIAKNKSKQLLTIGWYDSNNPSINDIGLVEVYTQYISGKHATLEIEENGFRQKWYIRDGQFYNKNDIIGFHNSKNGIIVNGRKIKHSIQLKHNDILIFGDTTIKIYVD
ncbi:protein kinase [Lutibacter sp.]|uniref:protein kinase domain-containing protein n=1 Tax=Lutibacter sp. TaxID=1925666 RepID=UPI00356186B2